MFTLHLDDTQRDALQRALDAELDDTRVQLRRAESSTYKASIREYVDVVASVAASLAPKVTLDPTQADVVAHLVRRDVAALGVEARHSSTWSYKGELKARRAALGSLLGSLPAT